MFGTWRSSILLHGSKVTKTLIKPKTKKEVKMNQKELNTCCEKLVKNKNLVDSKGKIKMDKLHLVFEYGDFKQDDSREIVAKLSSDGFITIAKGVNTYSQIQLEMVTYINEQLPSDLIKQGWSKFTPSSPDLINELKDEDEGICFDNALGDLIRIKANCDNVTQSRNEKKTKEQQKEMEKNMKSKS